ncbi:MAG: hypothetical protein WAK60_09345 [Sedimentisphaerales bacterium]
MNTFWLKIAALAIVVMAVIVLIGVFSPSEKSQPVAEPQAKEKNFYDMVEKDKKKFLAEPQAVEKQVQEQNQPSAIQAAPSQPVQPPVAKQPEQPTQLYFRPLSEVDKIEAERLLNVAVPGRSLGRLPMTGFKLMVDTCRQIISKWPDSWYAYNAQKMLIDMPERFRERYKITKEELDISKFTKQRPGTEPFKGTVEEESP